MARLSSVILYVFAGFFFYMVSLMSFFSGAMPGEKWGIMIVVTVISIIILCGGLAVTRFRCWKRDVGIVLLSSSGFTTFLVFTMACLFADKEVRSKIPRDPLAVFNDFLTGGAVIVVFAALGWVLFWAGKRSAAKVKENS
jgi:hypothetical protein